MLKRIHDDKEAERRGLSRRTFIITGSAAGGGLLLGVYLLPTIGAKAQVADELRARAFTRRTTTHAWIDSRSGWFVIDAAGAPRAESVLETLVATLDSFVPSPLEAARSPHLFMSSWIMQGGAPFRFAIDDDLELQSADETKSTIRYVRHSLDGKDIRSHLAAGKYPTRLGLTWNGRVSFVLTDKLCLKRIEFLEVGKDQTDAEEVDPAEQFDIDFAVMAGELSALLKDLAQIIESPQSSELLATQSKVA